MSKTTAPKTLDFGSITSGFVRCTRCPPHPETLAVGRVYQVGLHDAGEQPDNELVALNPVDPDLDPVSVAKDYFRWPFFDAVS
jgi:hypothetical protein